MIDDSTAQPPPDFAFAFDIDGVLVRSADPLPRASKALRLLQDSHIPFILLTNGGGQSESDRVAGLKKKLDVDLDTSMFVQSHTPFAGMKELYDKTILVCGGDYDKCQLVAKEYGFKNAITPGDIVTAYPEIWPFTKVFADYYKAFAKPLPKPIIAGKPEESLKIDAVFVYNDSRDWGLDITIITDLLLSKQGIMGTISEKNGDDSLPNRGYQQDGQPPLYFSNPDLWWAAKYHLSRLGQGGFRESLEGVWRAITGGHGKEPAELVKTVIGKPHQPTYEFAEKKLRAHRNDLFVGQDLKPLRKVYMVGDNPESDILGGNSYKSPVGSKWQSILLRTGVYQGGEPAHKPAVIVDDVYDAVQWAIEDAKK
ncbi:putative HAD superfamily hydrolase [Delphinella strobiligena]|nr:putative HAD superfamily hydrolase [Delphinella strobiligena]